MIITTDGDEATVTTSVAGIDDGMNSTGTTTGVDQLVGTVTVGGTGTET